MQSFKLSNFENISCVVADPLRFKLRLSIGEDAYTSLRLKKSLTEIWDVGGVAATGAAAAASPMVASTFFASTGGFLSAIGLGAAAATPIGWVAAAAVVSGGAYMGVMRLARNYSGDRVDVIPHFLNTPMDLLAASLFDLIAALASRIALIDGTMNEAEAATIARHFVADWGLDADYVNKALELIVQGAETTRVKDLARALASFQYENPDCNAEAMQTELMAFLKEVCEADGHLDEREELALDAVAQVFNDAGAFSLEKTGRTIAGWAREAVDAAGTLANKLPRSPGAG
jgi:uncharacterized tellurite resistance protein B-like protein